MFLSFHSLEILLVLMCSVCVILCVEIKCDSFTTSKDLCYNSYTCFVNSTPASLEVQNRGTKITAVSGQHLEGKTDPSVKCFLIYLQSTKYIPHKYMEIFPSLTTIVIRESKLKYVNRNDFTGASGLKNIWLDGNEIESIASDTFIDIPNLQTLFLHYNKLQTIGPDILTPFNGIITAYFKNNICIKTHFSSDPGYLKDSIPLSDLVTEIRTNCYDENTDLSSIELRAIINRLEHNVTFLYDKLSKCENDLFNCNSLKNLK